MAVYQTITAAMASSRSLFPGALAPWRETSCLSSTPRAKAQRRHARLSVLLLALLFSLAAAAAARGEESGGLDWSAWQHMPVLEDGRIMPLDTYARTQVKRICGDAAPRIGRLGTLSANQRASFSEEELAQWVRENQPRRFLAAELLYAWTVEPQKWADVPFLYAANAELRSEVLHVPLRGEDDRPLLHVTPRQVRASVELQELAMKAETRVTEAEEKRQSAKLTALQKSALELAVALGDFEKLSSDPARDRGRSWLAEDAQPWLASDVAGLHESWQQFTGGYPKVFPADPELLDAVKKTDSAVLKLADYYRPMQTRPPALAAGDAAAAELRLRAITLAKRVSTLAKRQSPEGPEVNKESADELLGYRQVVARWVEHLSVQAAKIRWGLYDAGGVGLFVVPALEPTSLEADRHRSEIYPWISLYAMLEGNDDLLQGYPPRSVRKIRESWNAARDAYLDHGAADRRARFSAAMQEFTGGLRTLAVEIEPVRDNLPIIEPDKGLLAKTAYPRAVAIDAEVFYNEFQPFRWACWTSLGAALILLGSLFVLRRPMTWLGAATLIASVLLLAAGMAVRSFITHWAPVTSMVETLVWVAMCVPLLSLWLNFLPLLGPASKTAWAWTAIPGSWESHKKRSERFAASGPQDDIHEKTVLTPFLSRGVALSVRLFLFVAGLYLVGVIPALGNMMQHGGGDATYGHDYSLVSLLPRADIGSTLPGISSTLVWLASIFVSGVMVWYVPRLVPTALLAVVLSIGAARRPEAAEPMEKVYAWRGVMLAGALASFLAALAANFAPFPRDIEALMPVLRSNFWLGIHVLTIVTSYAGAAVAWAIGNLALGVYLFGNYPAVQRRQRVSLTAAPEATGDHAESETLDAVPAVELSPRERRPPDFCRTLANLNYWVIKVTVLLLAAGTILGGLWADVSWGRFWGWDSKEVGALTALVILLTALHGRRAGWPGDLSLAIGAIMGFFGVLWAWYVVNWVLPSGMHSYGAGEGGRWLPLIVVVGAQLLFIAAALVRVKGASRSDGI